MSTFINLVSSWLLTQEMDSEIEEPESKIMLISVNDLINVKLKPVKNIMPSPARNMPPIDKRRLGELNKAQLKEILSIQLKPLKKKNSIKIYMPRHPVLRELLETVPKS